MEKLTKRCYFSAALCFLVRSGKKAYHPHSCSIAAVSGGCLTQEIVDFSYYLVTSIPVQ